MADEDRRREIGDIVLAPNEWLLVRDQTKGNVDVFVGPCKTGLSGTDKPVVFDEAAKRFIDTDITKAIQTVKTAPEGYYVVLKNPATGDKHPTGQGKITNVDLIVGRKVNIPGPVSFALWPGQMAKVLKGHHIRSNQYLLVRVYDEEGARANWKKAVVKPAGGSDTAEQPTIAGTDTNLTIGALHVIKGTDVSFYIPPTGVEVVPDETGKLVREAVTLGQLEYCLLYDENGNKRYERGPAVVFPKPTEVFAHRDVTDAAGRPAKTRKFKPLELNENSGIYVKVIADYDEGGQQHKVGEELFITGRDQMIYFPREEHAIVRYDGNEIHYGIAIPAGEARYVLDRNRGVIRLVEGPTIFLPDPRKEVVVRRILDTKTCQLLYPGNKAALAHNAALAGMDLAQYLSESASNATMNAAMNAASAGMVGWQGATGPQGPIGAIGVYSATAALAVSDSAAARGLGNAPAKGFSGDAFQRNTQYTEPRTITLPTKFDGAVTVDIWTGYAVMLVRKNGDKRVVQGPKTVLLEYDETPQVMTLSTGKPKNMDAPFRTAFLMVRANKVSDIVEVETKDLCKLRVKLSYRVNFEGDPEKWFDAENYVKFLCDHERSKLRNAVMQHGVQEFYTNATEILRDVVLGKSDGADRPGTPFKENGMRIYDVEVLEVSIDNKDVAGMLTSAQREAINQELTLQTEQRKLDFTKQIEGIKQETALAQFQTASNALELKQQEAARKLVLDLAIIESNARTHEEQHKLALSQADSQGELHGKRLLIEKSAFDQKHSFDQQEADLRIKELRAEVQGVVDRFKAVDPAFAATLSQLSERAMVEKIAEAMAPISILGGGNRSVVEIVSDMLKGTGIAKALEAGPKNGSSPALSAHKS